MGGWTDGRWMGQLLEPPFFPPFLPLPSAVSQLPLWFGFVPYCKPAHSMPIKCLLPGTLLSP